MSVKEEKLRNEYYITSLEENIASDDIVRVIDEIIEQLDLKKLGFVEKKRKNNAGNSRYPDKAMLKLFVYGYRRGIRSGRKLEDINKNDIRFQWLLGKLTPDANTINDYRKNHIKEIEKVFYEVNRIYIELGILKIRNISQDGFKIKAVNSKEKNYTRNKVMERIKREAKSITTNEAAIQRLEEEKSKVKEYLETMEVEESKEKAMAELETITSQIEEAKAELEEIEKRKKRHESMLKEMAKRGTRQISLTDPESRLMKNNGKFEVCYNTQTGVDVETHLTVAISTDNNPADVGSLSVIGEKIKKEYGEKEVQKNVTDKGYHDSQDMVESLEMGVIPEVTPMNKESKTVRLETEYEAAEIGEEERNSTKGKDIKKCIRAGIIPECYKEVIESIEVEEYRKYEKEEEEKVEEQIESSEEIRARAMEEEIFIKDRKTGCVYCPMGEFLNAKSKRAGGRIRYANKLACKNCKNPCTQSKYKEVEMGEKQNEVHPKKKTCEKKRERRGSQGKRKTKKKVVIIMKVDEELLKKRMATSEHSQGTMKSVDKFISFHMKGKKKVSSEVALHFLASNIRRVGNMIGVEKLLEMLRERKGKIEGVYC